MKKRVQTSEVRAAEDEALLAAYAPGTLDDADLTNCGFLPWVGPTYNNGCPALGGLKVLVLGESHYRWGLAPALQRFASRVVMQREVYSADHSHRFHSMVASTVARARGGSPSPRAAKAFWKTVAFYNYVQEYVGDQPGDRPTDEQFSSSVDAFREVLHVLTPGLVLACGKTLYGRLEDVHGLLRDPIEADGRLERSALASTKDQDTAVVGMIMHPSRRGYKPVEWAPRVRRYAERVGQPDRQLALIRTAPRPNLGWRLWSMPAGRRLASYWRRVQELRVRRVTNFPTLTAGCLSIPRSRSAA